MGDAPFIGIDFRKHWPWCHNGTCFLSNPIYWKDNSTIIRRVLWNLPSVPGCAFPSRFADFVEADGAIAITGRALFPTFLQKGGGFQSVFAPAFDEQAFSRLAFYVTGSQGIGGSIPLDAPPELFPGLRMSSYLDVVLKGAMGITSMYWRSFSKTETCYRLCASSMPEHLICRCPTLAPLHKLWMSFSPTSWIPDDSIFKTFDLKISRSRPFPGSVWQSYS